jgi:hypothetical protein
VFIDDEEVYDEEVLNNKFFMRETATDPKALFTRQYIAFFEETEGRTKDTVLVEKDTLEVFSPEDFMLPVEERRRPVMVKETKVYTGKALWQDYKNLLRFMRVSAVVNRGGGLFSLPWYSKGAGLAIEAAPAPAPAPTPAPTLAALIEQVAALTERVAALAKRVAALEPLEL